VCTCARACETMKVDPLVGMNSIAACLHMFPAEKRVYQLSYGWNSSFIAVATNENRLQSMGLVFQIIGVMLP
jgi:hypothetical protein